ncbi:dihydrodipicolinate synthase family protein [Pelosinus propionicus]|uniref:4-hydroxy-tetrahydrodipicolinate synthase n=1 Tax=Pelosinus propionicus DSM 13327 TaxID=1123291 RepID=A0A1I4Q1P5_9FIRM|nr:dihydrodipicolinate synthase family protein [Pelosinus propionicus]SFM33583.1 4-hydroxy-tetrahydrodipicolinate synthase [Pelosinus propionicus DSM 13327]
MNYSKIRGVIAAMVTPLDDVTGEVSFDGLSKLLNYLVEGGVHGLFPCGSTGEGLLLSKKERMQIVEFIVREVKGKIPIIVHTGSIHLDEAIHLTCHSRDIGAQGAALIPPYYYGMDEAAMENYFGTIAASAPDFPLYIYNIPGNTKNTVSVPLMLNLSSKYSNIIGLKESSMDFMNFINFQQVLPLDYTILMGNDAQIYSSVLMGGAGAISATATVFPEKVVEIYEQLQNGNQSQALQAQDTVTKLRAIWRKYPPIAPYKIALRLKGINVGLPRLPLRTLTSNEINRLISDLESLDI